MLGAWSQWTFMALPRWDHKAANASNAAGYTTAPAAQDAAVQAVVLTGRGRAFSVGADIKAMDVMTYPEFAQAVELYQSMCREARGLDKPVIAAINGFCLSGGLEVALMADIRIAARSAKLGLTDVELGFSPTGGLTYLLNHIVGAGWAMHLAMAAQILTAEESIAHWAHHATY